MANRHETGSHTRCYSTLANRSDVVVFGRQHVHHEDYASPRSELASQASFAQDTHPSGAAEGYRASPIGG
jgi:hypothetical protein